MPVLHITNTQRFALISLPGFAGGGKVPPSTTRQFTLTVAQVEQLRPQLQTMARQNLIQWGVDYINASPDGLDAEFITVEDAQGLAGVSFTSPGATTYQVGGIAPGTTYTAAPLNDVILDLLFGPAPPGTGEVVGKVNFAYNTPSPLTIINLAANDVLNVQAVVITTPFNGVGSSLRLGTVAAPNSILSSTQITPTVTATYETSEKQLINVPEIMRLTIVPGTATQGAGYVLYNIRR